MYPEITAHRIPYDIDGTEVGFRKMGSGLTPAEEFSQGITTWYTTQQKQKLNSEDNTQYIDSYIYGSVFWFFFPEEKEIARIGLQVYPDGNARAEQWGTITIQGSTDTTNGMDGTWDTAVFTSPIGSVASDYWRNNTFSVSFAGPVKVLRMTIPCSSAYYPYKLAAVHVYGQKAVGETPEDIVFTDGDGVELTALMDFGDQPEGTTEIRSFRLKNTSETKLANAVNVQLNHNDFSISFNADGPWQSVLDISSMGPGATSGTIYIRNQLAPPLLLLGPKAARVIVTVGNWT